MFILLNLKNFHLIKSVVGGEEHKERKRVFAAFSHTPLECKSSGKTP